MYVTTVQEMTPEDSDFVCNCGAIELPETDEEKEKFVQDYKKEVKKELIVPTVSTVVMRVVVVVVVVVMIMNEKVSSWRSTGRSRTHRAL